MSKFTVIVKLVVCFVELGIFSIVSHGIVEAAVALMYINGSYKPVRERGAEKKKRRRGGGGGNTAQRKGAEGGEGEEPPQVIFSSRERMSRDNLCWNSPALHLFFLSLQVQLQVKSQVCSSGVGAYAGWCKNLGSYGAFGAGHGSFMWWSKMWCREGWGGNIICAVQQIRLCAITGVLSHSAGLTGAV